MKNAILTLFVILVPLEKLSTYIDWPLSLTLKAYFIIIPILFFVALFSIYTSSHHKYVWLLISLCASVVVSQFLSTILAADTSSMGSLLFRAYSLLIFLTMIIIVRDEKDVESVLKGLFIAGVISALYGYVQLIQYYLGYNTSFFLEEWIFNPERLSYASTTAIPVEGGLPRPTGFNYDPNLYAVVLLIGMVSGYALRYSKNQVFWLSGTLFMLIPFVMTLSRMAYIIAVMIYLVSVLLRTKNTKIRLTDPVVVFMLFVAVFVFWDAIYNRFFGVGELSTSYHLLFGKAAIMLGLENPYIGHGVGSFETVFLNSKYNPGLARANTHSLPLNIFFEGGIIGLICYTALLAFIVTLLSTIVSHGMKCYDESRYIVVPMGILALALLGHNLVNDYFYVEFFLMFLGASIGIAILYMRPTSLMTVIKRKI